MTLSKTITQLEDENFNICDDDDNNVVSHRQLRREVGSFLNRPPPALRAREKHVYIYIDIRMHKLFSLPSVYSLPKNRTEGNR